MEQKYKQLKIGVGGMTCNHCKANVEKNVLTLEGVQKAFANPDTNELIVQGDDPDLEKIRSAVEDIGYEFKGEIREQ